MKRLFCALSLATFMSIAFQSQAQDMTEFVVDQAWAVACEDDNSLAIYIAVDNTTGADSVSLVDVTSSLSDVISLIEVENACAGTALDEVTVPAGERLDFWEAELALVVATPDDYEAGTPFSLILGFESNDVVVGVPVLEEAPEESALVVDMGSVWARPTVAEMDMEMEDDMAGMEMGGTSAVYMTITNPTDADDALVAATTNITDIVEIHETSLNENDVMMMRPVEDGIPVLAEAEAVLRPGGFHVMLLEPAPMAPGDTIELILEFESGDTITLAAPVEDRVMGMMMDMNDDQE